MHIFKKNETVILINIPDDLIQYLPSEDIEYISSFINKKVIIENVINNILEIKLSFSNEEVHWIEIEDIHVKKI